MTMKNAPTYFCSYGYLLRQTTSVHKHLCKVKVHTRRFVLTSFEGNFFEELLLVNLSSIHRPFLENVFFSSAQIKD